MKIALLAVLFACLISFTFASNCALCSQTQDKCDLHCACENDHSVCASSCCSNDVCSEASECEDLLKPGFIALIVIAVIVLIVILLCVFAACTGICQCILCCWRDKFRERKYLPNRKLKTAIHEDLSMEALGHSEEEEEAFSDFPFKEENATFEYKLEKDFNFGEFERNESERSTNVTRTEKSSHKSSVFT